MLAKGELMLKKIMHFFMGQPTGYVSPTDRFLARVRKQYPQSSVSQAKEVQQHQKITQKRDGTGEEVLQTKFRHDF